MTRALDVLSALVFLSFLSLLTGASCDPAAGAPPPRSSSSSAALPDSMGAVPTRIAIVPAHARKELVENSAAAMSRRQRGVFFTINDSGNDPVLFAMDT